LFSTDLLPVLYVLMTSTHDAPHDIVILYLVSLLCANHYPQFLSH